MNKVLLAFIAFSLASGGFGFEDEGQAIEEISSHLIIHDFQRALSLTENALQTFKGSPAIKALYIQALSECGEEKRAIESFKSHFSKSDLEIENHRVLEPLAWSVLKKGEHSAQQNVRLLSLVGAFYTHDVKAVPLLSKFLRSTNAVERALAVRLSSMYRDQLLKEQIIELFNKEKVWYVRLEILRAIGIMGIDSMGGMLEKVLADHKATLEEKSLAIESFLALHDVISEEKLQQLIKSDRAGLRLLGCEIVLHLDAKEWLHYIVPLLEDSSPEVRVASLNILGMLGLDRLREDAELLKKVEMQIEAALPEVSITASWALLPIEEKKALDSLKKWMISKDAHLRRTASAALARGGKKAQPLILEMIKESKDPFVKANLSLGLIGQRKEVAAAAQNLFLFLEQAHEKIMWDRGINPLFVSLAPSRVRHIPQVPSYPHVIDQLTRLNLLNHLTIVGFDKAEEAIKSFLDTHHWGITGAAAVALLEEGDSETLDLIRKLLCDPNKTVQLQAALALAILSGDPEAMGVLMNNFSSVDWEKKLQILEALGHIGVKEIIPFLVAVFDEPFQTLRIVAAQSLIQCLYH